MSEPSAPFLESGPTHSNRSNDLNARRKSKLRDHEVSSKKPVSSEFNTNQNRNQNGTNAMLSTQGRNPFSHEGNLHQSPSKKVKREVTVRRSPAPKLGKMNDHHDEELRDDDSELFLLENTTLISVDSNRTNTTAGMTTEGSYTTGHDENQSIASDCNTETSSVAHLRHLLDDFGQQNKKHFQKTSSIGTAPPDAKRVTRPKIDKAKMELPPTPLPPRAKVLLQRQLDPRSVPRARATPVRLKTRRHSDVEATNDGYQSVAKLSAWLADDPTKSKKQYASLRRGANIIAKSRAFDKGLADVIIEEHHIRNGTVRQERKRLEQIEDEDTASVAASTHIETSSSISVSHKKEWLASAFKKPNNRACTELVTDQEKREDVTVRAKQMWRQRSSSNMSKPTEVDSSKKAAKDMWRERAVTTAASDRRKSNPLSTRLSISSPPRHPEVRQESSKGRAESRQKENNTFEPEGTKDGEAEKELGFSEARKLLVQRSKKNGHNVEVVNKVAMRKAKFERIEREHRRRSSSHGLLKPHWEEASPTEGRRSTSGYVKSFVADPTPKKSIDELP